MLYSVVLKLRAESGNQAGILLGECSHALFFNLLKVSDERVAAQVHRPTQYKPFTASLLVGRFRTGGASPQVIVGNEYSVRLTFLSADLFAHFMDAVLKLGHGLLETAGVGFRIVQALVNPNDSPLCNFSTFEALLSSAMCQREVTLQFSSPTAFRSGGRRNVIFPEPALVFGSYLSRWRHFSPPQANLSGDIGECFTRILVHRYQLKTKLLTFKNYKEIGFQGKCTFELGSMFSDDQVRVLNALADFAFYCGTGAKTTMGMGQTRRLK